jgi:hypothetical protein
VADVVGLAEPTVAAREAAAAVSIEESPSQGRRDRTRFGAQLEDSPIFIVLHHYSTRVTSQALGRFRGNARAIFDGRLAGLIGILEHGTVDMDDHLVVLGRSARIDAVVKRGFGQQLQSVGLLLRHRRRFRGNVCGLSIHAPSVLPLIQHLTGRRQGFHEERTGLWGQTSADRHAAVFGWIHVEGTAGVLPGGLVPRHDSHSAQERNPLFQPLWVSKSQIRSTR